MSNRIDVHTHAICEDVIAALTKRGLRLTGGYQISVLWTPEAALSYMDRHGIATQVVSLPMAFAGTAEDPEFGTRTCRMINEANAELIATHRAGSAPSPVCPPTGPTKHSPNSATP